jgi:hypothetical protein
MTFHVSYLASNLLVPALVVPMAWASETGTPLAVVRAAFVPVSGTGLPARVSLSSFYFEVNQQTGRARVVIDYAYDGQQSSEDGARGPAPSYVQDKNLIYDAKAHTIVYWHDGNATICATVFGKRRMKAKTTGRCFVRAIYAEHVHDNGWALVKSQTLEAIWRRASPV